MKTRILPTDPSLIMPGEQAQLILRLATVARVRRVAVGEGAKVVSFYAGKTFVKGDDDNLGEQLDATGEGVEVTPGAYVVVIARNVAEYPLSVAASVLLEEPEDMDVATAPTEPVPQPPPVAETQGPRNPAPVQAVPHAGVPRLAAPKATPVIIPEMTKTLEEHGLKAGANEVPVLMLRNEVNQLLHHLRTNTPIEDVVKYGIIRRLDTGLKHGTKDT